MRCDWKNDATAPYPCRVINLDTGKQLIGCLMADEETGEYERLVRVRGQLQFDQSTKLPIVTKGIARLEIIVLKPGEDYLEIPYSAKSAGWKLGRSDSDDCENDDIWMGEELGAVKVHRKREIVNAV